ncbi:transketolase [Micromonospora sp. RP3T]|uniref:transketolase n=1 Tax=Micromonospora sp. RP3T TaxID=2135446 RepID=UPI000D15C95E|nr:transketolase [Micromonospora sp. RP3T]PTA46620.1 transketolase [Micromonospora sp. RP3T]
MSRSHLAPPTCPDTVALAAAVREQVLQMACGPEGAHVGGALSSADILACLYGGILRVDPRAPAAPDRDRFVLSKGHAAVGLYAVLALRGFFPVAELAGFGRDGSRLTGHPPWELPGVDFATGSLGHGLAVGLGFALAAQRAGTDQRTVVLLGDGEQQEGSVWEAAAAAGRMASPGLLAITDCNGLQINGTVPDGDADRIAARWAACGWRTEIVDGHDHAALREALRGPDAGPRAVVARTVKGKGVRFMQGQARSHHVRLTEALHSRALRQLTAGR